MRFRVGRERVGMGHNDPISLRAPVIFKAIAIQENPLSQSATPTQLFKNNHRVIVTYPLNNICFLKLWLGMNPIYRHLYTDIYTKIKVLSSCRGKGKLFRVADCKYDELSTGLNHRTLDFINLTALLYPII